MGDRAIPRVHPAKWLLMALTMADPPQPWPQALQDPCAARCIPTGDIGTAQGPQNCYKGVGPGSQRDYKAAAKRSQRYNKSIGKMLQRGCKLFTQYPHKARGSGPIGGVGDYSPLLPPLMGATAAVPGPAGTEGLLGCSRGVQPYPWAWSGLFTRQTISSTLISPLGTVLRSFS